MVTTEGGTRIVVDPSLHGSEGAHSGLPESPFTVDDLADADVVAVTHAGFDHRVQAIDIALAGSAILASGTALYGAALDSGVPAGRCAGMVPGVTFRHGDATLKAVDAGRHTSNMVWKGQFVSDEPPAPSRPAAPTSRSSPWSSARSGPRHRTCR
jgi:L-ascorbate metabolism protein UlaG (beta-lactamase superfamily)